MPKLTYDKDWTEDDETLISEVLDLTEQQETRLFTDHKAINVAAADIAKLQAAFDAADAAEEEEEEAEEEAEAETTNQPAPAEQQEADEADMIDISIAAARDRDAISVGEKLSEQTNKLYADGYEAREKVNITPLLLRKAYIADEGDDIVAMWPVPGSYVKGGKVYVGTGNNAVEIVVSDNQERSWDKYKYQDVNSDTGKQVTRSGSYYGSFVRATVVGKRLAKEYELLTQAINSYKDSGPAKPAQYKDLSRPQCVRRRNLAKTRLNYMEAATRTAIKLDKQCRAMDDLPNIKYWFETEMVDGVERYVNRNEPVQMCAITGWIEVPNTSGGKDRVGQPGETMNKSISAFCRYDVAAAIAKVGGDKSKVTLEDLEATVKREPKKTTDQTKDDWSKHEFDNISQVENVIYSFDAYFTDASGDVQTKRMTALEDLAAKDEKFFLSLGNMNMIFDEWWSKNKNKWKELHRKNRDQVQKEHDARIERDVA